MDIEVTVEKEASVGIETMEMKREVTADTGVAATAVVVVDTMLDTAGTTGRNGTHVGFILLCLVHKMFVVKHNGAQHTLSSIFWGGLTLDR